MKRLCWRNITIAGRLSEGGYVAILTILLFTTVFGLCAFAVDVGNWYYTGQRAQRAADAAALAGVPRLPGDPAGAFSEAQAYAKANGFDDASSTVAVDTSIDGQPTRLRVTTSMTVQNQFGSLFGLGHTRISRTAVADYAGPVPMGSPCNEFGNDPEATGFRGTTCTGVSGQFWASVNSPSSDKGNGDQYQSLNCGSSVDGCSSGSNRVRDRRLLLHRAREPDDPEPHPAGLRPGVGQRGSELRLELRQRHDRRDAGCERLGD